MPPHIDPAEYETRPHAPAIGGALLAMLVATATATVILFQISPPRGWADDAVFSADLSWFFKEFLRNSGFAQHRLAPSNLVSSLSATWNDLQLAYDARDQLAWRLSAIGSAAFLAAFTTAPLIFARTRHIDTRRHHEGRQFLFGRGGIVSANKALKTERKRYGRGMRLAPGVALSKMRELRNLMLVGAPNSGKTRIILFWLTALIERVEVHPDTTRLLVHDTTGEILAGLPLADEHIAALHPHKRGGWSWYMGRDVATVDDAGALATRLINPRGVSAGENHVFDAGGVTCLTGCIVLAQKDHGPDWGPAELLEILFEDPVAWQARLAASYPAAAALILIDSETAGLNRTSASFVLTFRAHVLNMLDPLARAWGGIPPERRFSFVEWLDGANAYQPPVVVLQRSARHAELSAMWIGAIVDLIAAHASDEQYNRDRRMRCHLVLDEIHQLGALSRFQEILDVGRNKNVSVIAALQDFHQPRILYGADGAKAFLARFATKIIGQMPGEDAAEASETIIKTRKVLPNRQSAGTAQPDPEPETVPIVRDDHIAYELGVHDEDEVRAVVVGLGDVVELAWPVTVWPARR